MLLKEDEEIKVNAKELGYQRIELPKKKRKNRRNKKWQAAKHTAAREQNLYRMRFELGRGKLADNLLLSGGPRMTDRLGKVSSAKGAAMALLARYGDY
jgi:hypothetical protein